MRSSGQNFGPTADSPFLTTRWTVVTRAGGESADAEAALAQLCRDYWYPLYAFARRRGLAAEDAQDATQGFFYP